jgi:hypothetical protein
MIPGIRSIGGLSKQYLGLLSLGAEATANSIYTNYNIFMSAITPSGTFLSNKTVRSTVVTTSSGRYQENFIREWSPGITANTLINNTNDNTIIFVGMTFAEDADQLVSISGAEVNNVSVQTTEWFKSSISGTSQRRTVSVSYVHYSDSFSTIKHVKALFDGPGPGTGAIDNEFAAATIFVLPGRWVPNTTNISTSSISTMPMTPSDLALYFGSHSSDSAQVDATIVTGTQIGYNSGNWYGGQSVGLMYSNNNIITANVSTSSGNSVIAKLTWSP